MMLSGNRHFIQCSINQLATLEMMLQMHHIPSRRKSNPKVANPVSGSTGEAQDDEKMVVTELTDITELRERTSGRDCTLKKRQV